MNKDFGGFIEKVVDTVANVLPWLFLFALLGAVAFISLLTYLIFCLWD